MHLLSEIEKHLRQTGTPPTRFGRDAARDPRLVLDLRRGREPGRRLSERLRSYMAGVQ
jgi:hypothetical protein